MNEIKPDYNFSDIKDEYIVLIDGRKNRIAKDFLQNIWLQLKFPGICNNKWDAYLDWIRDLDWIKEKNILIIIENFKSFLSDEPIYKQYFIDDFSSVIFPYWENDAIEVFEDESKVKNITVVCLDGEAKINMENITENINQKIKDEIYEKILEKRKNAHTVSYPVLRKEKDKVYWASFVSFYNGYELKSNKMHHPSIWAVFDIVTGDLINFYDTVEYNFSDYKYNKLYDISFNRKIHPDYFQSLNFLSDIIRQEYILNGKINEKLYEQYLQKILDVTSEEYQVFYEDLSKLEN